MADHRELPRDFVSRYGPWAVIAGGSEGIGESFARYLARAGINLVLLARRRGPLEDLAQRIQQESGTEVRAVSVDLTAPDLVARVAAATDDIGVGLLIFNAGSTIGYNRFNKWRAEDLDFMLKLNCMAPVQLAHHFSQGMVARGRGGMMFLTSAAAFAGSAHMAIYPATKAFDHILAEGLWHDLKPAGIDCLSLVVGATRTPSHKDVDFSKFNPDLPDGGAMACDDVAWEGLIKLPDGPTWIVGEHNRARYPENYPQQRQGMVEMMSSATAAINGLEHISALE
jgi:short-subunit dehydrogenase